jgi:hypothetical protein
LQKLLSGKGGGFGSLLTAGATQNAAGSPNGMGQMKMEKYKTTGEIEMGK